MARVRVTHPNPNPNQGRLVARVVRDVGRAVEALADAVAAVGLVHLVRVRLRVRVRRSCPPGEG